MGGNGLRNTDREEKNMYKFHDIEHIKLIV